MQYQAKSAIWSEFFNLKQILTVIWSEFILRYGAIFRTILGEYLIYLKDIFDLKRIFIVLWSKFFTQFEAKSAIWSDFFHSVVIFALVIFIVNFSLRYEAKSAVIIDFFDMKRIFVGYQTNFRAISSKIRNLKRIFRSEANLYSDMKKKNCMILSEIQYPKRNFWSEALLSCDLDQDSTIQLCNNLLN